MGGGVGGWEECGESLNSGGGEGVNSKNGGGGVGGLEEGV